MTTSTPPSTDLTTDFSRDCLTCDGPQCDQSCPTKRCSRCRTTFYCSVDCQKQDWKQHKPYCKPLEEMKNMSKEKEERAQQLDPALQPFLKPRPTDGADNPDQECPICLQTPMQKPVTLAKCQHSFCTRCLVEWQRQCEGSAVLQGRVKSSATLTCPFCRGDTEDLEQELLKKASLLCGEANLRQHLTDAEKLALRENALEMLDQVLACENPNVQAYITKAEILILIAEDKKDQDEDGQNTYATRAVETLDSLQQENDRRLQDPFLHVVQDADQAEARGDWATCERLRQKATRLFEERGGVIPNHLGPASVLYLAMFKSRAQQCQGEWSSALQSLAKAFSSLEGPNDVSAVEQRKCFMDMAKCAYHAGEYENAIAASDIALEMNRAFDQVHRYRALALKELGRMDEAIATMNRAIFYETPWNDANISQNIALYRELVEEQKSGQESASS